MSYPQYPAIPPYPPPPSPGHGPAPQAVHGHPQQSYAGPYPGYVPAQAGYPAPPAHPAQQPAQHVYPGQAYPAPQPGTWAPAAPAPGQLQCRFCGSVPAVKTTFGGHQGMLIVMRMLSQHGPFCRDCGLATFREMTAKTLVQGWWGWISLVATPVTVLWNLLVSRKVRKLAPPAPTHPQARPMDPGAPLLQRPMTIAGLAIGIVLFVVIGLAIATA
ncbi:hypothetical protein ONA70_21155 [Micromonospora yasonensis]|uniref:hypothetical protein n=1 Tax=Micromonospora yasonensis TaxID=1128667 RepID=UPI00222E13DB|nr:hypothetical protein [Micromonospora yasonensis]MCW3842612.1 hypothetical protein [Micromonospora yasonensis]